MTFTPPLGQFFAGWDCKPGVSVLYWHGRCRTQTVMSLRCYEKFRSAMAGAGGPLLYCKNCRAALPAFEFQMCGEPHAAADG